MDNQARIDNFKHLCLDITKGLQGKEELIGNISLIHLQNYISRICKEIDDKVRTDRELRIGIVGGVKAGKSSFLNSLLFKGEPVLPQAVTPMTAALTKISYSEKNQARIIFYEKYEWEQCISFKKRLDDLLKEGYREYVKQVEEKNNKISFGKKITAISEETYIQRHIKEQDPTLVSSKELVDMYDKQKNNLSGYLGTENTVMLQKGWQEIQEYVGAEGKFTPIVKYIELEINDENLKGYSIVDTPGLNDPIISRSEKTKEYLENCDVVLMLSKSTRFLTQTDLEVLSRTLPTKGVQRIILLGSQIDSALMDYHIPRGGTVKLETDKVYEEVISDLSKTAAKTLSDQSMESLLPDAKRVFVELQESMPPIFVSSRLFDIGCKIKEGKPLNDREEHDLQLLKNKFSDFPDNDSKKLIDLSNINRVKKEKFGEIISKKDEDIRRNSETRIFHEQAMLLEQLGEIRNQTQNYLKDLETMGAGAAERQLKSIQGALEKARKKISAEFQLSAVEAKKYLLNLGQDIIGYEQDFSKLSVKENVTEEAVYHTESSWIIFTKDVYDGTRKVYTYTANVPDAIRNIDDFLNTALKIITHNAENAFDIEQVKSKIKTILIELFDKEKIDFDEDLIMTPIELVLKQITIPEIPLNKEKFHQEIYKEFAQDRTLEFMCRGSKTENSTRNTVSGNEDIQHLRKTQIEVLGKISGEIADFMKTFGNRIEDMLKVYSETFIDELGGQLEERTKILEEKIKTKQESIKNYEDFLKTIDRLRNQVKDLSKEESK